MSDPNEPSGKAKRDKPPGFDPDRQREVIERLIARHYPAEPDSASDSGSQWATIIGPCYSAVGIGKALGMTAEEVAAATKDLRLLSFTTSDGVVLYPAFQVVDGAVVTGLDKVLRTLQTGTDHSSMWAMWLRSTPQPFDERSTRPSYIELLAGGDVDGVVLAAAHTAWAWRM
jgi:hypothetical protein